jgi:hypothetical protein
VHGLRRAIYTIEHDGGVHGILWQDRLWQDRHFITGLRGAEDRHFRAGSTAGISERGSLPVPLNVRGHLRGQAFQSGFGVAGQAFHNGITRGRGQGQRTGISYRGSRMAFEDRHFRPSVRGQAFQTECSGPGSRTGSRTGISERGSLPVPLNVRGHLRGQAFQSGFGGRHLRVRILAVPPSVRGHVRGQAFHTEGSRAGRAFEDRHFRFGSNHPRSAILAARAFSRAAGEVSVMPLQGRDRDPNAGLRAGRGHAVSPRS